MQGISGRPELQPVPVKMSPGGRSSCSRLRRRRRRMVAATIATAAAAEITLSRAIHPARAKTAPFSGGNRGFTHIRLTYKCWRSWCSPFRCAVGAWEPVLLGHGSLCCWGMGACSKRAMISPHRGSLTQPPPPPRAQTSSRRLSELLAQVDAPGPGYAELSFFDFAIDDSR